jgi:hypothetical protein
MMTLQLQAPSGELGLVAGTLQSHQGHTHNLTVNDFLKQITISFVYVKQF